jgi:hypothetical protein
VVGIVESMARVALAGRCRTQITKAGAPKQPLSYRLPLGRQILRFQRAHPLRDNGVASRKKRDVTAQAALAQAFFLCGSAGTPHAKPTCVPLRCRGTSGRPPWPSQRSSSTRGGASLAGAWKGVGYSFLGRKRVHSRTGTWSRGYLKQGRAKPVRRRQSLPRSTQNPRKRPFRSTLVGDHASACGAWVGLRAETPQFRSEPARRAPRSAPQTVRGTSINIIIACVGAQMQKSACSIRPARPSPPPRHRRHRLTRTHVSTRITRGHRVEAR